MTHSAAANALNTFEPSEKIRQVTFHNLNKGDFFTFEPNPFNPMVKISANQAMNKKSEIVVFEPKSRSVVYKFN